MPGASVVVTNHNYERFLGEAIESVLGQTEATELVVVDDGSTDGSRDVLGPYEPVARTILQPNAGQAAAMNAGFVASTGDIVCFLDADDRLDAAAMARARGALVPGAAAAHWRLREVDEAGRPTGACRPREEPGEGDLRSLVVDHGPDSYVHPPTSGSAWTRSFLEAVMPLPELEHELGIGSASADAYLATLAPLHGRLVRAADGLSDYRLHGSSDYSGTGFRERLRRDLATYAARCRALARECERQGHAFDAERWRQGSWVMRLARAVGTMEANLPDGEPFLLIDDAAWAMEVLDGRRAIPFTEREGRWWGPPADDAAALTELERAYARGVRRAVVGWPAFWWLDHYPGLHERLATGAARGGRDGDVLIFEIAPPGTAS